MNLRDKFVLIKTIRNYNKELAFDLIIERIKTLALIEKDHSLANEINDFQNQINYSNNYIQELDEDNLLNINNIGN